MEEEEYQSINDGNNYRLLMLVPGRRRSTRGGGGCGAGPRLGALGSHPIIQRHFLQYTDCFQAFYFPKHPTSRFVEVVGCFSVKDCL